MTTSNLKLAPRQIDRAYLDRVRSLPCCVCGCEDRIEAHHAGKSGVGRKADDTTAIPICTGHHCELHSLAGHFKGWDKAKRREWEARMIEETQAEIVLRKS